MKEKYSVLMSVYYKENPLYLKQSIDSMITQTIKPSQIVLICDGQLSDELNDVIEKYQNKYRELFNVIRFDENKGLGYALKVGVENCKNDFIARMDSDDISKKDRCEKELDIFKTNPNLGIVGSNIEEFSNIVEDANYIRKVPEKQSEIMKFIKKRNPFNHPSVMFKKKEVLKAGNYQDIRFMQDYFLWIDMIANGTIAYNIQENLVSMRVDNSFYNRRSGKEYLKIQHELLKYMKEKKIINSVEYFFNLLLRSISAKLPNKIRRFAFIKLLRKKAV